MIRADATRYGAVPVTPTDANPTDECTPFAVHEGASVARLHPSINRSQTYPKTNAGGEQVNTVTTPVWFDNRHVAVSLCLL